MKYLEKIIEISFLKKEQNGFEYNKEIDKYILTEIDLDEQEDIFLLNDIQKEKDGYNVEIIEYIEDYSQAQSSENEQYHILIKNLQGQEIGKVNSNESETIIQEFVKNNIDKFSKKKLLIKKDENEKLYILKVE